MPKQQNLPNLLSSLHSLHSVGTRHASWQQFADQTSDLFDADGCLFCFREIKHPDTPIAVGVGKLSEEFARQIISTTSKSPYYRLLRDSAVGKIIGNGDIITEDQAQTKVGLEEYYGDVLQSTKFDQVMGAIVYRDDKYEAALSIARNKDRIGFAPHEQQLFNEFLPHLRAMIEIYFQHYIKPHNEDVGAFINQLCENLAILDSNAIMLQSNSAFDKLKSRKSLLYVYGGKVHFYDKVAQQWFNDFLTTQHKSGSSEIYRIKADDHTAVVKLSVFGPKQKTLADIACPRYILSIDHFDVDERFVQYKQLFGLTRAEAQLAAHLSQGKTINQLADEKLLSKHTLRTQLKSIFMKTDTHSQNELIVLLKNVV